METSNIGCSQGLFSGLLENGLSKHSQVSGEGRPGSPPGSSTRCLENTGVAPASLRLCLLLWKTRTEPMEGLTIGVNHLFKMLGMMLGPVHFP